MRIDRLKNVIRALREKKDPKMFSMYTVMHPCGTPACCMGEYASREDLQDEFSLKSVSAEDWYEGIGIVLRKTGLGVSPFGLRVASHFGITVADAEDLFGSEGCAFANTPDEAAHYIEEFIKHKRLEALDEMVAESENMGLYDDGDDGDNR